MRLSFWKRSRQRIRTACYASVAGRMEEAKERLRHAIELDEELGNWRSKMKI